MQKNPKDGKLHPVAYYSRQTIGAEKNYHSYELETLAAVESVKKFRPYLLGSEFVLVTDCNALTACTKQKKIIPRVARWLMQLQEYQYTTQHRPGNKMMHADALSRNPIVGETTDEEDNFVVKSLDTDDWILSAQLTDPVVIKLQEILKRTPENGQEKFVHKRYALRQNRVYRITPHGLRWVVPRGLRHEIVRIAHESIGHCALEKTMTKLSEAYWFDGMRPYVEKYIRCCIPCLYAKRKTGKQEGFLHPIPKGREPLGILHVDHVGPFPKTPRRNEHLIAAVDGFTKFTFLRAVKSTNARLVIEYLRDIFETYGVPKVLVTDQGSAFTSKQFKEFLIKIIFIT